MRQFLPALIFATLQLQASSLTLSRIPAGSATLFAASSTRTYYLYVTVEPATELFVYKSRDLANWEGPQRAFQLPEGFDAIRDARVSYYRGKYYLFATVFHRDAVISKPPESWRVLNQQGIRVFTSDTPEGPFLPVSNRGGKPYTATDIVALDGSLYVEGDLAWLVYAHDWTQLIDANIEAVRLKADLSGPVEDALYLFKASDAPWYQEQKAASASPRYYPASAPLVHQMRSGGLLLIWSGIKNGSPAASVSRSVTGKIRGPWAVANTLITDGNGVTTIFRTFDGRLLMLVRRSAGSNVYGLGLRELEETADTVRLKAVRVKEKGR